MLGGCVRLREFYKYFTDLKRFSQSSWECNAVSNEEERNTRSVGWFGDVFV